MLSIFMFFPNTNYESVSFVIEELNWGMRKSTISLFSHPSPMVLLYPKLTKYWLDDWAKKATMNGLKPSVIWFDPLVASALRRVLVYRPPEVQPQFQPELTCGPANSCERDRNDIRVVFSSLVEQVL